MTNYIFLFLFFLSCYGMAISVESLGKGCHSSGCATACRLIGNGSASQLEMKATFSESGSKRGCWDFPISADLSRISAIRLHARCINLSSASQLNLYLKCGDSWQAAKFQLSKEGEWEEILIPKTAFSPEGGHSSWKRVTQLRLAAWQGSNGPFTLQLSSLDFVSANASICLLRTRGDSKNEKNALAYARHLGGCLMQHGLLPAVIDDCDCTGDILKNYSLILVPYGEKLTKEVEWMLKSHVKRGGRLGLFFALPPEVASAAGFSGGTFRSATSLGISLGGMKNTSGKGFRQSSAAFIEPSSSSACKTEYWWIETSGKKTSYPALLSNSHGFWMTHVFLNQDSSNAFEILCALCDRYASGSWKNAMMTLSASVSFAINNSKQAGSSARSCFSSAQQSIRKQDYPGALHLLLQSRENLLDNGGPILAARPGELRGAWLRSWQGPHGNSWNASAPQIASHGINAVFPYLVSCYDSTYPSSYLRQRSSTDKLRECLEACHKNGIKVHVWMHCLNVEGAPEPLRNQWKKEGRLQIRPNGVPAPWLCPSNPENRKLFLGIVRELCRTYSIDGIHFDMIRFEGSQVCTCNCCKAGVTKLLGCPPAKWPQSSQQSGKERDVWLAYRRQVLSSLVSEAARTARTARKGIQCSAAVYPDLKNAASTVGQDWQGWMKSGFLDFLCPMSYHNSADMFNATISREKEQLGKNARLMPGIGVTVEHLNAGDVRRQIQAVRRNGLPGFIFFEYTSNSADSLTTN